MLIMKEGQSKRVTHIKHKKYRVLYVRTCEKGREEEEQIERLEWL